jgi:hypothetical protein
VLPPHINERTHASATTLLRHPLQVSLLLSLPLLLQPPVAGSCEAQTLNVICALSSLQQPLLNSCVRRDLCLSCEGSILPPNLRPTLGHLRDKTLEAASPSLHAPRLQQTGPNRAWDSHKKALHLSSRQEPLLDSRSTSASRLTIVGRVLMAPAKACLQHKGPCLDSPALADQRLLAVVTTSAVAGAISRRPSWQHRLKRQSPNPQGDGTMAMERSLKFSTTYLPRRLLSQSSRRRLSAAVLREVFEANSACRI